MKARVHPVPAWIGGRIRREREKRGWRQQDLAGECGMSQSGISHIEAGHDFTVGAALAISEAFGLRLADLLAVEVSECGAGGALC